VVKCFKICVFLKQQLINIKEALKVFKLTNNHAHVKLKISKIINTRKHANDCELISKQWIFINLSIVRFIFFENQNQLCENRDLTR
jgi:hypothetical protein